MTESVTVRGGASGITARIDDLFTMARLVDAGLQAVLATHRELCAPNLTWPLAADNGRDPAGALRLRAAVGALIGPFGRLAAAEADLDRLADQLRFAATVYRAADDTVLESMLRGLGHTLYGGVLAFSGDYSGARRELFAGLPQTTDIAIGATAVLAQVVVRSVRDGHAVVHDLGPDETAQGHLAPRSLAGLVGMVAARDSGRHGEISVTFVHSAGAHRRVIVAIPGTKSWNPLPNHDVTSVGTDIRALAGHDTAYEEGIFTAMRAAGVRPDDDVMLVGHSEGGIVAVNAARDAARSQRFRITHVVTAGSPIGVIARQLPSSVQVLALENASDVVPHCDGADNPDRLNITTITVHDQRDGVSANHDLTGVYELAAAAADASHDASIRAFTSSAHGFLSGTTAGSHVYWITRGF